jgi:hypothetical protein
VLLPIEQGLTHVDLVDGAVFSALKVIEIDLPGEFGPRIVCREVIVRLEALIMRIDGGYLRAIHLKIEIHETL